EPVAVQSPYTLVWQDEFDYKGFPDSTKWSYDIGDGCPALCGWGNDELQHYTRRLKNARVENGHLIIEVHKEDYEERKFTSARLVTRGKQDWKYGRFEIRAKLPLGKGIWSAIWMLHSDSSVYGVWPKSGEIDIMENVGYDPDTVVTAAHTGAYYFTIGTQKESRLYVPTNSEEFHTYVLEWDEDEYRIFVNDLQFFTFPNEGKGFMEWPFDQKFYLVMNIAYGGNWGGAMGLEEQKLPQRMEIDYVRVYQKRTDDNSN
ncbi:MAG: glycoside hydrolase family 16 protein, partial [Bacteroidota bacterium]